MSLHYSLDSLTVRGCRVFGWGFCLDTATVLEEGRLCVPLADGRWYEIHLLPGGYREDLVRWQPDVPHAGGAGFMVQAILPAPPVSGEARLRFRRAGEWVELPLTGFPEAFAPPQTIPMASVHRRFWQVWRQRGALAALIAGLRGGVRRLARLRSHKRRRWPAHPVLILDHGMGGGAARYGESRLAFWRGAGRAVAMVAPQGSTLDFSIAVHDERGRYEHQLPTQEALLALLETLEADVLEINSLVGFDDVPAVLAWALAWRRARPGRHLRFNLHDFHGICPAFTLIDFEGRFCGIPALTRCRECLPRNAISTLGLDTHRDISQWRASWQAFLTGCDRIAAFSMSSVDLLRCAYPGIDGQGLVEIEGHQDAGKGLRRVKTVKTQPAMVAVLGHISRAKGADLLRALAGASEDAGRPLEFVVFGTLEGGTGGHPSLRVLGRYTRDTLCDHLEAEGVSLALLPSVCPETYSYVADEIMAMGLPLAVLDRGAPAERVRRYPQGRVLAGDDPTSLFRQLLAFVGELM